MPTCFILVLYQTVIVLDCGLSILDYLINTSLISAVTYSIQRGAYDNDFIVNIWTQMKI